VFCARSILAQISIRCSYAASGVAACPPHELCGWSGCSGLSRRPKFFAVLIPLLALAMAATLTGWLVAIQFRSRASSEEEIGRLVEEFFIGSIEGATAVDAPISGGKWAIDCKNVRTFAPCIMCGVTSLNGGNHLISVSWKAGREESGR
jgi:hypothetical protein